MRNLTKATLAAAILALPLLPQPAAATALVADGITYTLTSTVVNAKTETFTLNITGINGASDTEKGRYGVQSLAFTDPGNATPSVIAPTGFTLMAGGLNSSGCDGSGNFFCLAASTTPTGPALAADSSLSYTFSATTTGSFPSDYNPDFKINWIGTKKNYDLVSKQITPDPVTGGGSDPVTNTPEPASLALLGAGLFGLGMVRARRKNV